MTNTTPTKYQATHRPLRIDEVLCDGRSLDAQGRCEKCGRWTPAAEDRGQFTRDHAPNETGSLGYVYTYADGSTRSVEGTAR